MLSLSPAKLLVVLLVALIVLGPEKLPQVARQFGALWGDVRKWRARLETEVRSTFPDLPPTHEVVQAVRSPLAFLDKLADAHEGSNGSGDGKAESDGKAELTTSAGGVVRSSGEPATSIPNTGVVSDPQEGVLGHHLPPDDPSMN